MVDELQCGGLICCRHASKRSTTGAIAQFLASEEGMAFAEAVPALYATLDDASETDGKLADLYSMQGVLLMSTQPSSGHKTNFEVLERAVDPLQVLGVWEKCNGLECKAAGSRFLIHPDGQFDTLSKVRDIRRVRKAGNEGGLAALFLGAGPSNRLISLRKNGNGVCGNPGPCPGLCGPGCFNPGSISTPECVRHDSCVCMWGHLTCVMSIPASGCENCSSLLDAAWSFVVAFFSRFGEEPEEDPFRMPGGGYVYNGW
jgi:hypothetical protein